MPIEFKVENSAGASGGINVNELVDQMRQAGYNPHGFSSDGMTLTLDDGQGPYQVKTEDALQELGWQVKDARPENVDYNEVKPAWRAEISMLPNDDMRKAYLEGKLKRAGHQDVQIMGKDKSWYAFNPASSQWVALTNQPGIGMSDAADVAAGIPRFVGSLAGGAAAGAAGLPTTGPGAIATAAIGAGLGGGAGDALTRGAMAYMDPDYRKVAEENMGDMAKDVGLNAGVDAVTMGGAKALGPITKGLINRGPISSAVRGLGATAEVGGKAVAGTAKFLGGVSKAEIAAAERAAAEKGAVAELGHAFTGQQARQDIAGAMMIPGMAETQAASFLAQTPAFLTRSALSGVEGLGEAGFMRRMFPNASEKLRNLATALSRTRGGPAPERMAEEMAAKIAGEKAATGGPLPMRDVYGNIGESLGGAGGRSARQKAYDATLKGGAGGAKMPHADAVRAAEQAAADAEAKYVSRGKVWRGRGETFGNVLDTAEQLGNTGLNASRAVTRGTLRGIRGAGRAAQAAGRTAKLVGRVGQPIEARALARYGTEEALGPDYEALDPWSPRRPAARMNGVLATQ